jgi:transcriptional regulator with XRE-family HTH domain
VAIFAYKLSVMAKIESFYVDVGQRIRAFRTNLGLTQDQLGRLLIPPTSRVSIANVESGKQRILSHTLVQFAEALKVEPVQLLPARTIGLNSKNNDHAIANELVSKAGLSKTAAKKLVENPQALKEWKEDEP